MAKQVTTNPIVFAHEGPLGGESWVVSGNMIIGREAASDIQIIDRQVSRRHAKLAIANDGQITITDLESKNGVFINGDRITGTVVLQDGDAIKIALIQELLFVSSDATIPLDVQLPGKEEPNMRLYIDTNARRVWIGDEELLPPLSVQQYKLLTILYNANGKVVSREMIVMGVWGSEAAMGVSEQALDALVRRLRERIHKEDPTHEYISTVRGVGFIFKNVPFKS